MSHSDIWVLSFSTEGIREIEHTKYIRACVHVGFGNTAIQDEATT
jgi:hypothetical protein